MIKLDIKETTNTLYPETAEQMGTGYKVEYANKVREKMIDELYTKSLCDLFFEAKAKSECLLKECLVNFIMRE